MSQVAGSGALDRSHPLLGAAVALLRFSRGFILYPVGLTTLALLTSLLLPKWYTSTVMFLPQSNSSSTLPSAIAAYAGQFGLTLPIGSDASPDLFADLVSSQAVMRELLVTCFKGAPLSKEGGCRTLLDVLDVSGDSLPEQLHEGTEALEKLLSARVDRSTNVVTVDVTMRSPTLALEVAQRLVDLLNKFNVERLQSQSGNERRFAAQRLEDAVKELRTAEDSLQRFLESNRTYAGSPLLQFQADRLQRRVQLRQE